MNKKRLIGYLLVIVSVGLYSCTGEKVICTRIQAMV